MDKLNVSIGPFELFSSLISGLPVLISALLWFYPTVDIDTINATLAKYSSLTMIILVIIASFIIGNLISGFTWRVLAICVKVFRFMIKRDLLRIERLLLGNLEETSSQLNRKEFLSLDFKGRLAYMVKRLIGGTELAFVCNNLLPYLRQNATANAAAADAYIAMHIMLRNLWFGFLLLTIVLIRSAIIESAIVSAYTVLAIIVFVFSLAAFHRALVFKGWWSREILIGFYHHALKSYSDDVFTEDLRT
jgi:hypothetical protein